MDILDNMGVSKLSAKVFLKYSFKADVKRRMLSLNLKKSFDQFLTLKIKKQPYILTKETKIAQKL